MAGAAGLATVVEVVKSCKTPRPPGLHLFQPSVEAGNGLHGPQWEFPA